MGLLATGLLCFFALRRVDVPALESALRGAVLWPVALAMAVDLGLRTLTRTRRTFVILRAVSPAEIRFGDLLLLILAAGATGQVIPGPSEEVVQTAVLKRFRFRLGDLLAAQVVEKSLSALSVALLALLVLPPIGLPKAPLAVATAALGAVALSRASARRGIALGRMLEAFVHVVVSNLLCVVMMWLCFSSVGVHPPLVICLKIFCVTACAGALPLSPGQIGVLEVAFVMAATRLGLAGGTSLAVAILYHASHFVPAVCGGLIAAARWRAFTASPTEASWSTTTCLT